MTRRRDVLFGLVVFAATGTVARAEDAADAAAFIRRISADLPDVVGDAGTPAEQKRRLAPYLAAVVDEPAVARFCLGRYWRVATPAQQEAYTELFRIVLLNSVASRVAAYQAGRAGLTVGRPDPRPEGTYVPTTIQPASGNSVHITWMVGGTDAGLRVMDVIAEGISLRLTQRSDYAAFLERNNTDIDALIAVLRRQALASRG